jgi:competence protein ComGC
VSTSIPGSPLLGGFMARLSQRERVLLGMLLLVFFVISVTVLFMLRNSAMAEKQTEIDALRRGLDLVYTRGTVYDLKKKEKAAREARIASIQPMIYSSLLEEAQKTLTNGTVRGEEEKPSVEVVPGVLTKRLYGFEVRGVGLEELLNFLTKLEQEPGHFLIVERLAIKSPSSLEDRLNVEVELATWEMLKQPPPVEGEPAVEGSEP